MTNENLSELFAHIRTFDWDEEKRERILRERQIDFQDARFVIEGPTIVLQSDRKSERRYMVFGFLDNVEVVVICTIRGDCCWIVSARRVRRDERKKFHSRLPRRSTERQD